VGTSIIKIWIENYVRGKGKNHQWFEFALLKKRRRKDVKKDPNSVANGRFHCLVALGRFHWLTALERFHWLTALERFHWLTALERFHCLVANGRWKRNTFSLLPTSPQQILLKLSIFFPLTLKSYFTMVLSRYLRISFLFLWVIHYDYASRCNKSSTHSLLIWFWLKIWFFPFPWNYGVTHGHVLWASNRSNEWRATSGIIFKFDTNVASSWWISQTLRGVRSSWSWTPSSLVLSYFSKLTYPGDLVVSQPRF